MSLRISPVRTSAELEIFINLPWRVYKNNSFWVPPLKNDERKLLDLGKHPFWEGALRELFIAWRDGVPVGRIAGIVDSKYNSFAGEKCGAFGFFECLPDQNASLALLAAAYSWLSDQGMNFMRGPLSPSTNYTCGLLVQGYENPPGLMMPWNPPVYAAWFEQFRLRKEQDLFAYVIEKRALKVPDWLDEELMRLREQKRFTSRVSSKATLSDDARIMLDIYRKSWSKNFAFVPLSMRESEALVKELVAFLDPKYFVLFFHDGEPAGGMVALPDYTPLLKRLNGRIGITAPWHFLRTRKACKEGYRIILFGILEQYRLLGLPLLVFDYMLQQARLSPDFKWVEGSWVLEDNKAVDDLIEDFSGRITKRYRIYRKEIL